MNGYLLDLRKRQSGLLWLLGLLACLLAPGAASGAAAAEGREPVADAGSADVRLILDVSASMGRSDPDDHRGEALGLLLRLLPEDGNAGVWTYGRFVNMLVKYGRSDGLWKENAVILTRDLASVGQRANLLEAVDRASWDRASPGAGPADLILLTDGHLDVSDDPGTNAGQRRRLLGELAPELASAGFRVHALTLSDQADAELLGQLAALTGGYHGRLASPREMPAGLLDLLGWVAAPAVLPVAAAGTFRVAPGVRELTALRLGGGLDQPVVLVDPTGARLERTSPRTRVRWHLGESYQLVSLQDPAPGLWRFEGPPGTAGDTRVFAYGDLAGVYPDLPGTLFPGGLRTFSFNLVSAGEPVVDPEFLDLVTVSVRLLGPNGPIPLVVEGGAQGNYQVNLLGPHAQGEYRLETRVSGPTFLQTLALPLALRNPLNIEVRPLEDGLVLWTRVEAAELDHDSLRVSAVVRRPPGAARLFPVERHPAGLWKLTIPGARGIVEFELSIKGNYLNLRPFELRTQPIRLVLPVTGVERVNLGLDGRPILVSTPAPPPAQPQPALNDPPQGASEPGDPDQAAPDGPPSAAALMAVTGASEATPAPVFPFWLAMMAGVINLLLGASLWWLIRAPRARVEDDQAVASLKARLGIEEPADAGVPAADAAASAVA